MKLNWENGWGWLSERVYRMPKFFIDSKNIEGEVVRITGSDFNHISHSLRLKEGDKITVSTGNGWDYLVKLTDFQEAMVTGKIINRQENNNEPSIKITLAQAVPKKNNMELIIQKATEIGVYCIIPLETSRTIVKLKDDKRKKRIDRWQKIVEEAAKQSQRGIIPEVKDLHTLKELKGLKDDFDLILIPWESEQRRGLKGIWNNFKESENTNILIIIGPEGGFAEDEVDFVCSIGGIPITLGPRILRTETAGLVTLTMLLYETGDLGGN